MKIEFLEEGCQDCPLIRLYSFSVADVLRLEEILASLSKGSRRSVAAHAEPTMESVRSYQLGLVLGKEEVGIEPKDRGSFECVRSGVGWSDVAFWLEAFCQSDRAKGGHQWLNEDGKISLLVTDS